MAKASLTLKRAIIIFSTFGAVGFILWGVSLIKLGTTSGWSWAGGILVAFISFLIAFLSRWLK